MNTGLHAVTDTSGRPVRLFVAAGQPLAMHSSPAGQGVSDDTGAVALMNGLPEVEAPR
jgi:hypothetical protein